MVSQGTDTSGINELADDPDSTGLTAALRSAFAIRLTATYALEKHTLDRFPVSETKQRKICGRPK